MKKDARARMLNLMIELLQEFTMDVDPKEPDITTRNVQARAKGRFGVVRVTYFHPETAKDTPWLACALADWPGNVRTWNGFDHWKQNLHVYPVLSPEEWVQACRRHLKNLL